MTIYDLNIDQVTQLKEDVLCRIYDELLGCSPTWGELANAGDIIGDGLLVAFFDGVTFSENDFF